MNGVDDGFNVSERGGPPGSSVIMATNFVSGNLIINGHSGMWTLDRDDGSQFVNDTVSRALTATLSSYWSRQILTEDVVLPGERSDVRGLQAEWREHADLQQQFNPLPWHEQPLRRRQHLPQRQQVRGLVLRKQ